MLIDELKEIMTTYLGDTGIKCQDIVNISQFVSIIENLKPLIEKLAQYFNLKLDQD